MNCREYRELIDDALDTSLNGALGHRVKLHLEHCTVCRDYYEHRQKEHVALFTAMNAAYADVHLPSGFADNVIELIALEGARRKPFFARVPRWVLIAASLVAMAGFVFAAAVGIRGVEAADQDAAEGVTDVTSETTVASDAPDSVGRAALSAPQSSEIGALETQEVVPLVPQVSPVSQSIAQGEQKMTGRKAAAAALTAAMAAAPLAAANGDEYQFILSGDPVAAATVRSSSAASDEITLETGALRVAGDAHDLEARSRSNDASVTIALNATKFRTFIMTVR